ncbi:MAG: hypothetical protein C5B51_24700 [Terriglobia bacterium]|nr:MAG: hypothetical protein C5B51_24700 [Terriglobia bacterium]
MRKLTEVNSQQSSDDDFPALAHSATLRAGLMFFGILGIVLFVLIFVMIGSSSRELMTNVFAGAGDTIAKYAPLSYIILLVIVIVPIVAAIVVMKWPEPPEPENPLARFKHEDVMED